jgi:uncharacterized membrane protein YoaK (UPF0700 family)
MTTRRSFWLGFVAGAAAGVFLTLIVAAVTIEILESVLLPG